MLHVARLKYRGDPVGLHQFLLGQALGLHMPERAGAAQCAECGQRFPCRTTLLTALLTRLPVQWTRTSLGRALSTAKLWPSQSADHDVNQDSRLEYRNRLQVDPWYREERNPRTGQWLVRNWERGSSVCYRRLRVTWVTPLGLLTASIWKPSSSASRPSQSRSPRPSTIGTTTMCR